MNSRFQLKNAGHRDSVISRLWAMVNNNTMTDITLVSTDGHTIPVHKLVLVTSSDYFRSLQEDGSLDRHLLEFQGIGRDVMQELVRFMYTGSVYATYDTIVQIHMAASQLGMADLVSTCNVVMERQAALKNPPEQQQVQQQQEMMQVQQQPMMQAQQQQIMQQQLKEKPTEADEGMLKQQNQQQVHLRQQLSHSQQHSQQGQQEQQQQQQLELREQQLQKQLKSTVRCSDLSKSEVVPTPDSMSSCSKANRDSVGLDLPEKGLDNGRIGTGEGSSHIDNGSTRDDHKWSVGGKEASEGTKLKPSTRVTRSRELKSSKSCKEERQEKKPTRVSTRKRKPVTSVDFVPVKKERKSKNPVAIPLPDESDGEDINDDLDKDYVPVTSRSKSRRKCEDSRSKKSSNALKFICSVCGDDFPSDLELKKHKFSSHSKTRSYPGLTLARRLRKKVNRCKKINGGYLCRDCGQFFTLKNSYRGHAIVEHRKPVKKLSALHVSYYPCTECERVFKHTSVLEKHAVLHKNEQRGLRGNKGKRKHRFTQVKYYNKRGVRRKSSSTDGKTVCPVCRIVVDNNELLSLHLHLDHQIFNFSLSQEIRDRVAFQCPNCTKLPVNYTNYSSIRAHCKKKHKVELATMCFICNHTTKSRSALALHIQSAHKIKSTILKLNPLAKDYIHCQLNMDDELPGSVKCWYCKQIFYEEKRFFQHLSSVHYQYCAYARVKNSRQEKEGGFACKQCGETAADMDAMQTHFVNKHPRERESKRGDVDKLPVCGFYRCGEEGCYHEADEEWDLVKHMETQHPLVSYRCEQCPFSTRLHYQYLIHQVRHSRSFVCELCGRFCWRGAALKFHRWKYHGVCDEKFTVYRCDVADCRFECHQKASLTQHKKKHDSKKPFLCAQCGRPLKTQKSLDAHVARVHMGIRPYVCEQCGKSFTMPGEIKAHMKTHTEKAFSCDHCKFTTMNKYSLISHLLSIHDIQIREHEKLHKCPYCDYKTIRSKHLQTHINSHLNKRDFICHLCGKTFISASSLKGHHNWVHAEKAFKCEFCSYKCGALSNLKQHVRVMHTLRGLKPYKCFYCDFRCELSGNCRVHCRSAHKGLEVKWVKVVDFKTDLPSKEEAASIKQQESQRKKDAHEEKDGQLKTLMKSVGSEIAVIDRDVVQEIVPRREQLYAEEQYQYIYMTDAMNPGRQYYSETPFEGRTVVMPPHGFAGHVAGQSVYPPGDQTALNLFTEGQ